MSDQVLFLSVALFGSIACNVAFLFGLFVQQRDADMIADLHIQEKNDLWGRIADMGRQIGDLRGGN